MRLILICLALLQSTILCSSGAMDVIAVIQEDGSIKSTPFYVEFGTLSMINPKGKILSFIVNGSLVSTYMTLDSEGFGFFGGDVGRLYILFRMEKIL